MRRSRFGEGHLWLPAEPGAGHVAQSDQLSDAIRSPITTIEYQYCFMAARIREMHSVAVLIGKGEVGSDLSDGNREEESEEHAASVS